MKTNAFLFFWKELGNGVGIMREIFNNNDYA